MPRQQKHEKISQGMLQIALFFTCGISLRYWHDSGQLSREKRLYEELINTGNVARVTWITYGMDDALLAAKLHASGALHEKITVIPMPSVFRGKVGRLLYSLFAPWILKDTLQQCHIMKSNQLPGAWTAWLAARLLRKPFFFRTGYTFSELSATQKKYNTLKTRFFRIIERFLYANCTVASVTSQHSKEYITHHYTTSKLEYLPNFVETEKFCPTDCLRQKGSIVFVGRLHAEKNLDAFMRALRGSPYALHIYGRGEQEVALRQLALHCNIHVVFHGAVPNVELPRILRQYEYFILPSPFEGMPKALLEAMACGCVCLGADVPGVREIIVDGENGLLAEDFSVSAFQALLQRLPIADGQSLAARGVEHVQKYYSLQAVVRSEAALLVGMLE